MSTPHDLSPLSSSVGIVLPSTGVDSSSAAAASVGVVGVSGGVSLAIAAANTNANGNTPGGVTQTNNQSKEQSNNASIHYKQQQQQQQNGNVGVSGYPLMSVPSLHPSSSVVASGSGSVSVSASSVVGSTQAQAQTSQQQSQPQPPSHFASSNKQLVEHAKNAIAQAAQELAAQAQQQQQQHHQQQLQQQQQSHLHYHSLTNGVGAYGSPLNVVSPNDISPNDAQIAPYPSDIPPHHIHPHNQRYVGGGGGGGSGMSGVLAASPQSLSHSHPHPSSPHAPSNQAFAQILVANLPSHLTQAELSDIFSNLPSYERCGIALDPLTGISIGRGWLVFSNTEHAQHTIQKMNGIVVAGHPLHLSMMQPIGESTKSNIYVAGLPKQYTQQQLDQLFQTFGHIIESKILTDPSGMSRGVAFVRFDASSSAAQAITAVNGHVMSDGLHSYTVRVKFARDHHRNADPTIAMLTGQATPNTPPTASGLGPHMPRSAAIYQSYIPPHIKARGDDISGGIALFVFHIPAEFTSRDLQELFAPCATVLSARIAIHPQTLESKGFGFVSVATLEEAHQAVTLLNGRRVGRKFIKVSFKKQQTPTNNGAGMGQLVGGVNVNGMIGGGGVGVGGGHHGNGMMNGIGGGPVGVGGNSNVVHHHHHHRNGSIGGAGGSGSLDSHSLSNLAAALNLTSFGGLGGYGNVNGLNVNSLGNVNGLNVPSPHHHPHSHHNLHQQQHQQHQHSQGAGGNSPWTTSVQQQQQHQQHQQQQQHGHAQHGHSSTGQQSHSVPSHVSPIHSPTTSLLSYNQQNLPLHLLMQQMQLSSGYPSSTGAAGGGVSSPYVNGSTPQSVGAPNGAGSMYGSYSPNGGGASQPSATTNGNGNNGNTNNGSWMPPSPISLPQSALNTQQQQSQQQQQQQQSQQQQMYNNAVGQNQHHQNQQQQQPQQQSQSQQQQSGQSYYQPQQSNGGQQLYM